MSGVTIKNLNQLEKMRIAGAIVRDALLLAEKSVRPGITTKELDALLTDLIRSRGAEPSFLGYQGYPASICASVNDQVVHGIPGKYKLKEGDIISIDVGAVIDGYHGDAARTFTVGEVSEEAKQLIKVTEECFFKGIEQAKAGGHLMDIARAIQSHAESHGYGVVRDLVGHGIGRNMHEPPEIPNFVVPGRGRGLRLLPGMTFAIEPMINAGTWEVRSLQDGWTVVTRDGKLSAHYENTIYITENEPEILTL